MKRDPNIENAARALAHEDEIGWAKLCDELPETAGSYRDDVRLVAAAFSLAAPAGTVEVSEALETLTREVNALDNFPPSIQTQPNIRLINSARVLIDHFTALLPPQPSAGLGSLMAAIETVQRELPEYADWAPAEDPAEIVTDLLEDVQSARISALKEAAEIALNTDMPLPRTTNPITGADGADRLRAAIAERILASASQPSAALPGKDVGVKLDQPALDAACKAYAKRWMPSDAPEFASQAVQHVAYIIRAYLAALVSHPQPEGEVVALSALDEAFREFASGLLNDIMRVEELLRGTTAGANPAAMREHLEKCKALGAKAREAVRSLHPAPTLQGAGLIEALTSVRKSVKNARGAIESNQVTDKDVHGSLTRVLETIDAALAGKGVKG